MSAERPVLWFVGPTVHAKALSSDVELISVTKDDALWPVPHGARPVGMVVWLPDDGGPDDEEATLQAVRRRSTGTLLACTMGPRAPAVQHRLLRAGATSVLRCPTDPTLSPSAASRAVLRWRRAVTLALEEGAPAPTVLTSRPPRIVAIGSSTGGPDVLRRILTGRRHRVPIVISQHIQPGYARGLAEWLSSAGAATQVAVDGERVQRGVALLSPGDHDMTVRDGRVWLHPPSTTAVPSVDALFDSVARAYGHHAAGVLLTGMGADGAQGLLALRQAGSFTVTQRGDTAVVDGMPARARELGAACADWAPARIREWLGDLSEPNDSTQPAVTTATGGR